MGKFPRKVKGFKITDVEYDDEKLFEIREEAEDSIEITIKECEMWECVDCEEQYEDRDEAYNCCG